LLVFTDQDTVVAMVRGRNAGQILSSQQRTNKISGKKTKLNQANTTAQTSPRPSNANGRKNPMCLKCSREITDETKALNCDRCGHETAWKCIACLGITLEIYDALIAVDGPKLKWFCDSCLHTPVIGPPAKDSHDKLEEIITTMGRLMEKLCHIENQIDSKAELKLVTEVETKVAVVESKIDSIEHEINEMKQNRKLDETHVIDCVEKVLSARSRETIKEEVEKAKRKTNVIVHGLAESHASEANEREDDDLGLIASMLHEMKCDNVEVAEAWN